MKIIRLNKISEEERDGYFIRRLLTEPLRRNPENIGLYLTTIPASSKVECHFHPLALEIIIFLTNGTIETNEKAHGFYPGDIAILQPKEKHEIIAGTQEVKLIAVRTPNFPDDKVVCAEGSQ